MNFVVKASASFGLLLLVISNNPTQAFQLTGFNLYENDNFTAPKQYIDFTDPDDYHKIRFEYSLSNGETFKSMSLTLRQVEVFLLAPDQDLPILNEPFNEESIRFNWDENGAFFDIDILKATVDFEGIYKLEVKTMLNGKELVFTESKKLLLQHRCSVFLSTFDTSETNCTITATLGCKDRLYPKFWEKEAFVWSSEDSDFRFNLTNWKQGPINPDGTFAYFLEETYRVTQESPFGLSINNTFSFGAFQNESFTSEGTATFPLFDVDGCPSYEEICQSPPGELECNQKNAQEPSMKCRNYVISSLTNEDAKVTFECPADCTLELEGQVVAETPLIYKCDEETHQWLNSSGQSVPQNLPSCDCPDRGLGYVSVLPRTYSYFVALFLVMMTF